MAKALAWPHALLRQARRLQRRQLRRLPYRQSLQ
jgi:hypothetical protein